MISSAYCNIFVKSVNLILFLFRLGYSRVEMRGAVYEAVFIYCECAATEQIDLPGG